MHYQFLGLLVIFAIGATFGNALLDLLTRPETAQAIHAYSPWLAEHMMTLTIIAMALLFIVIISIPPMLMKKNDGLELIGMGAAAWIQAAMGLVAIVSIGYLAGIGWVAATAIHG